MIPVYLIIIGSMGISRNLFAVKIMLSKRAVSISENPFNERDEFMILLDAILASWFVIGTVWIIYVALHKNNNTTSDHYCNPILYTCVIIFGVYLIGLMSLIFSLIYHISKDYLVDNNQDYSLPPYEQIVSIHNN
ncbi:hypothetical protein HZS_2387 [Henneguya salminicola]|nr:hypothetical protein HZS_2387 [Henneguya salminicola]